MTQKIDLGAARAWFARDIAEVAPVLRNQAIVDAFAAVPREHYLGDGPWRIHSRLSIGEVHPSATTSPHHVYHDVLISIDETRDLNNGLPSLWARVYDNLDIRPGAAVCQIGAGVGYYTAILAELVSPGGHVTAFEIDPDLAARAKHNLRHYGHVEVICGDATKAETLPECDALTACAGVTRIPVRWFESLRPNGQLVLAMTGLTGWGILMHLTKGTDALPVTSLGPVGIFPCEGARRDSEAAAIGAALQKTPGRKPDIGHYHFGDPPSDPARVWVTGDGYWISCG